MGKTREAARRVVKDYMLGVELPCLYREAAKQPVDPNKVLFVNVKQDFIPDAFSVIMPYLEDRYDFDVRFIGLNQAGTGFTSYHARCRDFVKQVAQASYVFLEDASDVVSCLPLRPETKVVNLWHACGAFKKWGMSTATKRFGATQEQILRHPYYRNLDLVTVSSPDVAWAYREAMNLHGSRDVVRALGTSRTDAYFDKARVAEATEQVREAFPAIGERKIVLYAPTFRGPVKLAKSPDALDIAALKRTLGAECALVVKHHPFVKQPPAIPPDCRDFAFDASADLPIFDLLCAADVLVTDYSSVIFEYALLDRPMVLFAPDLRDYQGERGFYYDYAEIAPGPVCHTNEELLEALAGVCRAVTESVSNHIASVNMTDEPMTSVVGDANSTAAQERGEKPTPADSALAPKAATLQSFRQQFMSACDGHATERICEQVFTEPLLQAHVKPPILDVMRELRPQGIDVSIVMSTFNAQGTLQRALDSINAQTYDLARVEVIIVDDCSTDATQQIARAFAQTCPARVELLSTDAPTGSPSAPRNIGLARAQGEYVFIMDSDDWLGEQAIERMVRHAHDWQSDVLAVKIKGELGRTAPKSMFLANDPDVDVYRSKVMWTFGSYKLFRRELAQSLEFPSVMPEDISYVLRAYVLAGRVSVAADYDYYHLAYDTSEHANISLRTWDDVDLNLRAYEDIFGFIAQSRADGTIPRDADLTTLMRRLFTRDVCNTLTTIGRDADHARANRQLAELIRIVGPFYDAKQLETLTADKRALLECAFSSLG